MTNGKLLACAFAAVGLVSIPRQASAIDRLTDQEMKKLFETIEEDRSKFEGALDDKQKNTTIKDARGEVNANEFFDDFQDQVQRASDRFESDYSASSEVLSLLQYAVRLQGWTATQPAGFSGSKEWECRHRSSPPRGGVQHRHAQPRTAGTRQHRTSPTHQRRRARDGRRKRREKD